MTCPYCADGVLGDVFYDQTCEGCVQRMSWPFPTKDKPLKPWTKRQEKQYQDQQRQQLPEAPL